MNIPSVLPMKSLELQKPERYLGFCDLDLDKDGIWISNKNAECSGGWKGNHMQIKQGKKMGYESGRTGTT